MFQDRFIPNIIHMVNLFHQIQKIISVAQSVCKDIHQGPGTDWLPSNIKILGIRNSERNWNEYKPVQRVQRSRLHSDLLEK